MSNSVVQLKHPQREEAKGHLKLMEDVEWIEKWIRCTALEQEPQFCVLLKNSVLFNNSTLV